MYFCGRMGNVKYPAPVQLEGEDLPWVENAEHLGHTLHQTGDMDKDCNRARASFIDRSVDVRQQFSFAAPDLTLQMIQVLCCDGYGSMLWKLQSDSAESYFKSWNTCVKLVLSWCTGYQGADILVSSGNCSLLPLRKSGC